MPLTLTLSPQAGRGDAAHERAILGETGAAYPLRPASGEKVAGRPDEGPRETSPSRACLSITSPGQGMVFIISWVIGIMFVLR
ncbi:hypothetical protein GCM10007923_61530 [Shinella yambaruensis]|uniref:Uncharacterized protein n=1 Tax=Shinella yambaruensis TaxID=415996 RepID=A0ABQ5ZWE0_9HYPH|nr:hypothetical protein GCM10007923_61530 [Shinella yambaruensis]